MRNTQSFTCSPCMVASCLAKPSISCCTMLSKSALADKYSVLCSSNQTLLLFSLSDFRNFNVDGCSITSFCQQDNTNHLWFREFERPIFVVRKNRCRLFAGIQFRGKFLHLFEHNF